MAMELVSIQQEWSKQTGVHRDYLELASLVSMGKEKQSQVLALEQLSIQLASVKQTEALKVCLDMALLVFMERGKLSQVMALEQLFILLASAKLTEVLRVCLDMELVSMAKEMLSLVMELDMVLLLLPSIHMVVPAQITELLKDFPAMDILVMENDQLNQVMESVVSQLSSKADHTTMVLMVITLTMFMERDLLNQDISMELIQVNNMFQGPIPAMELMLPTPIKDC